MTLPVMNQGKRFKPAALPVHCSDSHKRAATAFVEYSKPTYGSSKRTGKLGIPAGEVFALKSAVATQLWVSPLPPPSGLNQTEVVCSAQYPLSRHPPKPPPTRKRGRVSEQFIAGGKHSHPGNNWNVRGCYRWG